MSWADEYEFPEPLVDLRDNTESGEALMEELLRELAPGHELHGRPVSVIARALPNDDVVVEVEGEIALVQLTWTRRKSERPPLPVTRFLTSAAELEAHVAAYQDEEPS